MPRLGLHNDGGEAVALYEPHLVVDQPSKKAVFELLASLATDTLEASLQFKQKLIGGVILCHDLASSLSHTELELRGYYLKSLFGESLIWVQ